MSKWKPIRYCPQDGTEVLIWDNTTNSIVSAWWDEGNMVWVCFDGLMEIEYNGVTHWMSKIDGPSYVDKNALDFVVDFETSNWGPNEHIKKQTSLANDWEIVE